MATRGVAMAPSLSPFGTGLKLARVFANFDTNTIRVLIAATSFIYACFLWISPQRFARDYWEPMRVFSEDTWAWLYMSHTVGIFWRQIDDVPRPLTGFAISAWGILLWFVQVGMLTQHNGVTPANAAEITMIGFGFAGLLRTGLNDDQISP